jgi:hypothetical protein
MAISYATGIKFAYMTIIRKVFLAKHVVATKLYIYFFVLKMHWFSFQIAILSFCYHFMKYFFSRFSIDFIFEFRRCGLFFFFLDA